MNQVWLEESIDLRGRLNARFVALFAVVSLVPGIVTLLYSQTLITVGIGATDWWWGGMGSGDYVSMQVSSSSPVDTETLHGEQLSIRDFNVTGGNVSIVVSCETNDTIAAYDLNAGIHSVQLQYPTAEPSSNFNQDFNVTINWIDTNATVGFYYVFNTAMHSDGPVTYIQPGYEETLTLGGYLLVGGLVLTGFLATVHFVRTF